MRLLGRLALIPCRKRREREIERKGERERERIEGNRKMYYMNRTP